MFNKCYFIDKLNAIYYPRQARAPLPQTVMIEATNACNLKCSICYTQQHVSDRYFLSLPDSRKIINQFPGIKELIFCGLGEPLLNRDLFDMVNIAKEKGVPFINLITNGKLLSSDIIDKIIKSGINTIQISVHSFNPDIFSKMRNEGPSALSTLKENIVGLVAAKKKSGKLLKICCNAVITKFNFNDMYEFIGEAKKFGVDRVEFIQLSTYCGMIEDINVSISEMSRIAREARRLARGLKMELGFLNGNEYGRCYQLWDFIMIHADGEVSPCNGIFPAENIGVGNILRAPIGQIWNSERYHELRQQVIRGKLNNCKYCEVGYFPEGKNSLWFKNYYLRPLKRSVENFFNKGKLK